MARAKKNLRPPPRPPELQLRIPCDIVRTSIRRGAGIDDRRPEAGEKKELLGVMAINRIEMQRHHRTDVLQIGVFHRYMPAERIAADEQLDRRQIARIVEIVFIRLPAESDACVDLSLSECREGSEKENEEKGKPEHAGKYGCK